MRPDSGSIDDAVWREVRAEQRWPACRTSTARARVGWRRARRPRRRSTARCTRATPAPRAPAPAPTAPRSADLPVKPWNGTCVIVPIWLLSYYTLKWPKSHTETKKGSFVHLPVFTFLAMVGGCDASACCARARPSKRHNSVLLLVLVTLTRICSSWT